MLALLPMVSMSAIGSLLGAVLVAAELPKPHPGSPNAITEQEPWTSSADAPDQPTVASEAAAVGPIYPMPLDQPVRVMVGIAADASGVSRGDGSGQITGDDDSAAGATDTRLVYENTLSTFLLGLPPNLPTSELADDIATVAAFGCNLDSYVVRVTGDLNGDGVASGNLTVFTALYPACPRGGGVVPIRGTSCVFGITVAESGGLIDLTCRIPDLANVPTPNNLYLGVSFGRADAGVVIGAPALQGFSANQFDHPFAACSAGLGGFPAAPHSSFYAQVYVREPCGNSFIAYKNTRQNERGFSPGAGIRFADDLQLAVEHCDMVAYEVSMKGSTTGAVVFDLRTCLSGDAENGCIIPGTRTIIGVTQLNSPQVARVAFDPPILIPDDLYISFRTTSGSIGPIATGIQAGVGHTEDAIYEYRYGEWSQRDLSTTQYHTSAFDVTITCAGSPPPGACCDMFLTEEKRCYGGPRDGLSCVFDGDCTQGFGRCLGKSVCRELPQMNCPFPTLWTEGALCDADPFAHPCGQSACCTPDDTCTNLTGTECAARSPPGDAFWWVLGSFCKDEDHVCPYYACLQRNGECNAAHAEPGCEDPFCCWDVCQIDPWCCRVEWDRHCVETAQDVCHRRGLDECHWGPQEIGSNGSAFFSNFNATGGLGDPPFCCGRESSNTQAFGTVWFKFIATHASASIRTCQSDEAGDSMVQVFAAGDPTDDATACATLIPIGCADDSEACGDRGQHAQVCVDGLIPGAPYYLMVASKTPEARGLHQLDIVSPCQFENPFVRGDCNANGVVDGCDLFTGSSTDCNENRLPDDCEVLPKVDPDCNGNARPDDCDIAVGRSRDCQPNQVPDECDLEIGTSLDCDGDQMPDECRPNATQLNIVDSLYSFGYALDVWGDRLAIGNPYRSNVYSLHPGACHLFRKVTANWVFERTLLTAVSLPSDGFATALALNSDWILIGAPAEDHSNAEDPGSVRAFLLTNGFWNEWPILRAPDPQNRHYFGLALATAGQWAAVLAVERWDGYEGEPVVYVFELIGDVWIHRTKLNPPGRTSTHFGRQALSMNGRLLALGADATSMSGPGDRTGAVFVFRRTGDEWSQDQILTPPDPSAYEYFGKAVHAQGDRIFVGADARYPYPSEAATGAVFVFNAESVCCAFLETVTPADRAPGGFGTSITSDGSRLLVGPLYAGHGAAQGYLFVRRDDHWEEVEPLVIPDYSADDGFRPSVALLGSSAVIGANGWLGVPNSNAGGLVFAFSIGDADCNSNGMPDTCDLREQTAVDCNNNALLDQCESGDFADADLDGDIDSGDFRAAVDCLTGPGHSITDSCCGPFDAELSDRDVDLRDLAAFLQAYEGP